MGIIRIPDAARNGPWRARFVRVVLAVLLLVPSGVCAAEVIPPQPAKYFNDYAQVVSADVGQRLDDQLTQFERDTSNQVVVAIFPTMQTDSDIADYTRRVAQSWAVGQREKRNGAVLFVFVKDRKMFIQVGYGLEGALPDATAYEITEFHIKPHFRKNDYDGGLTEGVDLICKAIRGEYKGTGRTAAEGNQTHGGGGSFIPIFIFFVILMIIMSRAQKRRGYRYSGFGGPYIGGWSGGSGGGWSSGGGGGGFSGGGGSFGGGGAGSSW